MRMMLALVALFGLAAHPAMAAPPVEKGVKELATGQKPSQETPAAAKPPEGSMVVVPAGEFMMGSAKEIQTNNRSTRSMWMPFPWMCMK